MATDQTVSSALLLAADDATVSWGRVKKDEEQSHQLAPRAGTRSSNWDSAGIHYVRTDSPSPASKPLRKPFTYGNQAVFDGLHLWSLQQSMKVCILKGKYLS